MNCDYNILILRPGQVQLITETDQVYSHVLEMIQVMKNCKKHDHREQIWQLEKIRKEIIQTSAH